jgi:hypothetical protein
MVCGVLGLGGFCGGSIYGGGKPKGFLFLVTLEASSCREEGSLYIVPQVLTSVGPFGLNGVF